MTVPALTRRALLTWAAVALPLAGCGATGGGRLASRGPGGRAAALLLPMTGAQAAVGQNMARAAAFAVADAAAAAPVFDTADSAAGAAAAARAALDAGARLLLGPLRADQTPAVLAEAGNVPVVTFSNDDTLAAQGAFVLGITPAQSVAAMFSYARAQGLTSIAVVGRPGPLGTATEAAARQTGASGGLAVTALLRDPGQPGLVAALRAAGGGTLPQAVFLPDGGSTLDAFAAALSGAGMQLLGSVQWGIASIEGNATLRGAWFAAPPPDLFLPFAERFQAAHGEAPGVVAALGHDAALMAAGLGDAGTLNRRGLLRKGGFTGVLGNFRFVQGGLCQRDLAVLTVDAGGLSVLAEVSGT